MFLISVTFFYGKPATFHTTIFF